jgi:hypothetical protein
MDHECLIAAAARFIELAGVALPLPGTFLAAAVLAMRTFDWRRLRVHCALNMRVPAFLCLYCRRGLCEDGQVAAYPMREVWQPDGVWQEFISSALARTPTAMPMPAGREGQP